MVVVTALLEQRTGQQIAPNRSWRIETALKPLLRARALPSLEALVDELMRDPGGVVAEQIVDALLNQETSFFRDAPIFDALLAAIEGEAATGRRPRLWSAACSTGQEPLSLAILLAERARAGVTIDAEIVATDVSEAALARARSGRYSQFEIQRGLSVRRMIDWFEAIGPDWVARPELVSRITFRRQNLVTDAPPPGRFDIILCRNVMLYLSPALRRAVLDRLALAMRPGGLLVLGAGETVIGQSDAFVPSARYKGLYEPATGARAAAA
ncbi:MAG: chemotaxis protein CheR [Proteobacteria bacterium SG_bin5]|nr:protein-glutamate O-methyltransferase CheR [Sphingomonas sp.]OQW39328.1 MAG: chemotaxis protein CheR [Proteobacteria bacterium SG_bin5]